MLSGHIVPNPVANRTAHLNGNPRAAGNSRRLEIVEARLTRVDTMVYKFAAGGPWEQSHMQPRLWTVFLAYGFLGVATIAAVLMIGLLSAWWRIGHADLAELMNEAVSFERTPVGFVLCRSPAHLVLLGVTWWLGRHRAGGRHQSLGMVRSRWSSGQVLAVTFASFAPFLLSLTLASGFAPVWEPDVFYDQFDWSTATLYLGYMTTAPAIAEELFFRGYMQRRLLQHWSPPAAILTTAVLFTVAHGITPALLVKVFPVALWLGLIAWKSGSIWPGCCCHAWINGWGCGWPILNRLVDTPALPAFPVTASLGILVGLCLWSTMEWLHEPAPSIPRASA
jgi:membrane protease YdiL (CAAX protease family)